MRATCQSHCVQNQTNNFPLPHAPQVDVHLSVNKNPRVADSHIAEVTVYAKGTIIRATEKSDSMYASIDLVTDRMARKLRKYKERGLSQKRHRAPLR